jgi:hypothetical protein
MVSKFSVSQEEFRSLRDARQQRIQTLKKRAAEIQLSRLPPGQAYKAIAISVDASNVPVELDVFDGMLVRCADSDGREYFQHIVLTDAPEQNIESLFDVFFESTPVLQSLLEAMQTATWRDFMPAYGRMSPDRFISEMLEWGTLVKLATESTKTILLKDGLLRTKFIKPRPDCLDNLRAFFAKNCEENGNFITGVAKTSKVFEHSQLLLTFVQGYTSRQAFYLQVAQDLLEESYGWRYIAEDVKWGELFFVRLMPHSHARVMTIEVPAFLNDRLDDILRILAALPLRSLPDRFRGLPDPLARAHENATLRLNVGKAVAREVMQNE